MENLPELYFAIKALYSGKTHQQVEEMMGISKSALIWVRKLSFP